MIRRKIKFVIASVVALSLLMTADDVTFAAQQQDNGFFGRLFGPSPGQPNQGYIKKKRPRGSNPYLFSSPDQQQPSFFGQPLQPFGQPFFMKQRPVRKPTQPNEPPLPTVEVKAKDPKARKILVVGDFLAAGLA